MKKIRILLVLTLILGGASIANAQSVATALNVPGSLLVFPLIDNLSPGTRTIIDLTNRADIDVWLQGFIVAHDGQDVYHKKDFQFLLTQKQPIHWDTSLAFEPNGGFVQSFDNYKGYIVIWAINNDKDQLEIRHDYMKGEGIVLHAGQGRAFRYNAIPHQSMATLTQDRELRLTGDPADPAADYLAASETILCEGYTAGTFGLDGILVVANLAIDFPQSIQPEFDINLGVWNADEIYSSRHVHFDQFEQYTLTELQLTLPEVNTDKFQFATSTNGNALWAVFYQYAGPFEFGGQCFMDPAGAVPTVIQLATVTQ
jgi:hypothetical protein